MNKQCTYCQKTFDAKRKDAKYCSDNCRKQSKRRVSFAAGKTPEEIRELKYKEMQNQNGKEDLPTVELKKEDVDKLDYKVDLKLGKTTATGAINKVKRGLDYEVVNRAKDSNPIKNGTRLERIAFNRDRFGEITIDEANKLVEDYEKTLPKSTRHKTVGDFSGTACMCIHCGEIFGSSGGRCARFCQLCRTAPQREFVDKLNYCVDLLAEYNNGGKS